MIKVEKIKEKLDLEVNDDNPCKSLWESTKTFPWSKGDMCREDCCSDCSKRGKSRVYVSEYY